MRNFYALGPTYIWQNCEGAWGQLNGLETIVIGNAGMVKYASTDIEGVAQLTDTEYDGHQMCAGQGQLRPKFPPSGEKSISEMFSKPYVKELDKERELEEAYE